jgi:hypothetical protein
MSLSESAIVAAKKSCPSVAGGGLGLSGSYQVSAWLLEKTAMSVDDQKFVLLWIILPTLGAITPWVTAKLRRWFGISNTRSGD